MSEFPTETDSDALASAVAAMHRLNEEDRKNAGPKTSYDSTVYKGIDLQSRWQLQGEFEVMREAVDNLPDLMVRRIASIWCDSKAGSCYVIDVRPSMFAPDLPHDVGNAFRQAEGGHNGILIGEKEAPSCDRTLAHLNPDWGEP